MRKKRIFIIIMICLVLCLAFGVYWIIQNNHANEQLFRKNFYRHWVADDNGVLCGLYPYPDVIKYSFGYPDAVESNKIRLSNLQYNYTIKKVTVKDFSMLRRFIATVQLSQGTVTRNVEFTLEIWTSGSICLGIEPSVFTGDTLLDVFMPWKN